MNSVDSKIREYSKLCSEWKCLAVCCFIGFFETMIENSISGKMLT